MESCINNTAAALKPKMLCSMEIINVLKRKGEQWQATLYSAALGIERKERAHGYSGAEPSKACLMFEMQSKSWSHEIGIT